MVNCLSIEEMYDFIEGCMQDEKKMQIDMHIQTCATCSVLHTELLETENELGHLLPSINVDDVFTNQVMNQLPKKELKYRKKRDWRVVFVTAFVTAALLFFIFSSLQQQSETSSSSVTMSVKDVNITDAAIEVTLSTAGYTGDVLFSNDSNRNNINNIFLVLPNGESHIIGHYAEQSTNEITFNFPLFDIPYDQFKLLFEFRRIYDIDGQWTLEVPIDRTDILAKTENVTLYTSFEKDGIDVNFIRAQHGPENTFINFETKFTEDMATFIEQQVAQYTAELPLAEKEAFVGYNAKILFNVMNADGQTLSRSIPEDRISIQNDRYAHTETLSAYPTVQNGGYLTVIGAKFELPTDVRHELTMDQLPYSFTYKGTVYEVNQLSDQSIEISSDVNTTTISNWHVTVDNKTAWDSSQWRTDSKKQYTTIKFKEDIQLDSFILYGQTESKIVTFDEPIHVELH